MFFFFNFKKINFLTFWGIFWPTFVSWKAKNGQVNKNKAKNHVKIICWPSMKQMLARKSPKMSKKKEKKREFFKTLPKVSRNQLPAPYDHLKAICGVKAYFFVTFT